MKIFMTFIAALFTGCATLPDKVRENVQIGDNLYKVKESMGEPKVLELKPEQRSIAVYVANRHFCEIYFQNETVTGTGCWDNPNYVNPALRILHGAGKGLSGAQRNTVTCTNHGNGMSTCRDGQRSYNCTTYGNTTRCH